MFVYNKYKYISFNRLDRYRAASVTNELNCCFKLTGSDWNDFAEFVRIIGLTLAELTVAVIHNGLVRAGFFAIIWTWRLSNGTLSIRPNQSASFRHNWLYTFVLVTIFVYFQVRDAIIARRTTATMAACVGQITARPTAHAHQDSFRNTIVWRQIAKSCCVKMAESVTCPSPRLCAIVLAVMVEKRAESTNVRMLSARIKVNINEN